jgi:hypothetical protein
MDWLKNLFKPQAAEVADALAREVPDFASATVEELTAYNQRLDEEVRALQAARAVVAKHIDKRLTGN